MNERIHNSVAALMTALCAAVTAAGRDPDAIEDAITAWGDTAPEIPTDDMVIDADMLTSAMIDAVRQIREGCAGLMSIRLIDGGGRATFTWPEGEMPSAGMHEAIEQALITHISQCDT